MKVDLNDVDYKWSELQIKINDKDDKFIRDSFGIALANSEVYMFGG